MPKLPVATAFWTPQPDSADRSGGMDLLPAEPITRHLPTILRRSRWATGPAAMGIEAVYIDENTTIRQLKNELRWNSIAYSKIVRNGEQTCQQRREKLHIETGGNAEVLGI